ncbi:MAG: coproporphyrinogen III oxidase [Actinomycetales bacterium]|nr:coproporphyrinogen III oxidase [Actinomycetales bacterium]
MSPALPPGEAIPPAGPLDGVEFTLPPTPRFGVYLHVPFCRVRCGYCDFNTYTAAELGGGASQSGYPAAALAEVRLAVAQLDSAGIPARRAGTVFFGGGTPTVLPASALARLLGGVRDAWGLVAGAEVTTEANPDTVDEPYLEELAAAGFTRISLGMQSAVPRVLATLDRTHTPANVGRAVAAARATGLGVSLDLIYGTPGESLADWRATVEAALALEPDHVSAYALGIEEGTRMGAQVRRGELPPTDPDDQAAKYELADAALGDAGLTWYEISNWARPGHECRHNLGYWRGDDWWGVGPGAHSHVSGVRFWNVRHPRAYAARLAAGRSPAAGREVLGRTERALERVMLGVRLSGGLDVGPHPALARLVADGLLDADAARAGRARLTLRGRLLADAVTRDLTEEP